MGLCFYAAVCADKDEAGQRRQLRLQLTFMKLGFLSHSPATIQPPQLACRSSQPSPCAADGGLSSALVGGRVLGFGAARLSDTAGRTAATADAVAISSWMVYQLTCKTLWSKLVISRGQIS